MNLRRLRIAYLRRGRPFHTVYRTRFWPRLFNGSRAGGGRFSPLEPGGPLVPTLYGASRQTVAMLETCFHDVHEAGARIVSAPLDLAGRGLVTLTVPLDLPLVDLTDAGLSALGMRRAQLVATSPAHYACTREWAVRLHRRRIGAATPVGLLWRSRVAELAQADSPLLGDLLAPPASDVFVLFGDRVPTDHDRWLPGTPWYDDLTSGDGLLLAELIAEQLGSVIVPA